MQPVTWNVHAAAFHVAKAAWALQGKTDPEAKRKTIGSGFIDVFRDFATTLKEKHGVKPKFLVQVTVSVPVSLCVTKSARYSAQQLST